MSFIGILTENKNEIYLKEELEKWGDVFFLRESTVDNMRNIKFETFLLGKKIEKNQEMLRNMAQKAKYFVLNSDIKENSSLLDNLDLTLITYGYNQKATITASSVEENRMMLCLQRSIQNVYKEEIEPQEIEIENKQEVSEEAVMELACLKLLYEKQKGKLVFIKCFQLKESSIYIKIIIKKIKFGYIIVEEKTRKVKNIQK